MDFSGIDRSVWITLTVFSIGLLVVSLVVLRMVVVRLPADYFSNERRTERRYTPIFARIGKNLLGVLLLGMGLLMLFTPGQGILTLLLGVMLVDFPGKYRLERWMITRPTVLANINKWRERAGKPPLVVDD